MGRQEQRQGEMRSKPADPKEKAQLRKQVESSRLSAMKVLQSTAKPSSFKK